MKVLIQTALTLTAAILACRCSDLPSRKGDLSEHRSVYYWKTVFKTDSSEMAFLTSHEIDRIYLRMFDVAVEYDPNCESGQIVPIATTQFASPIPEGIGIVPVVYITIDALRAMAGKESEYAGLITERLLAMSSYNGCGEISEVQFDCDWTATTAKSYNTLCQTARDSLHLKNIALSVTVRLHQLQQSAPPADKGVLMLYNTGAIKDPKTRNSILDTNDIKPYLRPLRYPLALDYAYPAFGWGVKFENGSFASIVTDTSRITPCDSIHIRHERPTAAEIMAVKALVEQNLGKPLNGNIIYHLDDSQLKNFTFHEINQILAH